MLSQIVLILVSVFNFSHLIFAQSTQSTIDCSLYSDSCSSCVSHAECYFCYTNSTCWTYYKEVLISGPCPSSDSHWGNCNVSLATLYIIIGVIIAVVIIGILLFFVWCCCCPKKAGHLCPDCILCPSWCPWNSWKRHLESENANFQMEQQIRAERSAQRREEMERRHAEIRRKYGLMKESVVDAVSGAAAAVGTQSAENPYHRFENEGSSASSSRADLYKAPRV